MPTEYQYKKTARIGIPSLLPEEVTSFDLHVQQEKSPFEDSVTGFRDTTAPCEAGGIYNPIAGVNVFGEDGGVGVCVPTTTNISDFGETTQKGI
jgi:iron complex outermembrane receptor protein